MNRKMYLATILLAAFVGMAMMTGCSKNAAAQSAAGAQRAEKNANGEYTIGSQVQVYDGNFKAMDRKGAYFTYLPSKIYSNYDGKAVILNHSSEAFFIGTNNMAFVRGCIDKAIEWAAVAKQNNVRSLVREIKPDGAEQGFINAAYMFRNKRNSFELRWVLFNFYIGEIDDKGKEGTFLLMQIFTQNQLRTGEAGSFYCFSENDFARLKEIFSEPYLADIDKREAALQQTHAEQNELFN